MPSVSKRQQHLMGAAYGGATFPAAKALRREMSPTQLRDFAATKTKSLPVRAPKAKPPTKQHAKAVTKSSDPKTAKY
jgi:hypothetical protein